MNNDVVLGDNFGIQLGSEQKLLSDALTIKPQLVKTASLCTDINTVSVRIAEAIFYLSSILERKRSWKGQLNSN